MGWRETHGRQFEVPGLIDYMVRAGVLEDSSLSIHQLPVFSWTDPVTDELVSILVDHPYRPHRTGFTEVRFIVQAGSPGEEEYLFGGDDLSLALGQMFEEIEGVVQHFPVRGISLPPGDPWHDPMDYLRQLSEEWDKEARKGAKYWEP